MIIITHLKLIWSGAFFNTDRILFVKLFCNFGDSETGVKTGFSSLAVKFVLEYIALLSMGLKRKIRLDIMGDNDNNDK
jgi:hypothetical protein